MNPTTVLSLLADIDWDGHMDWDGGWWIVMGLGMVIFWGLVIVGIVWLVRELAGPRRHGSETGRDGDPLAILDRRLAEGTITTEEYRERRAILSGAPGPGPSSDET